MDTKESGRRKFLKISGAVGAAGLLAGCFKRKDEFALPRDKSPVPGADGWYIGEEKNIASSCAQCPVNCGIMVRVVEGRAVKINGNPQSVQVDGKLGPKGQTGLFTLYDPDRIKGPLMREGARGEGKWKSITWDEALAEAAKRLGALRSRGEAHKLAVLCGRPRGFMKEILERFCAAYGTPNFFDPLAAGEGALVQAMDLMMGIPEIPGYDADHTSFILSLGSGIFESTCNGIHFARGTGAFRRGNPTRRSFITHVDPNFTTTAKIADDWIPLRKMGTYDVLALGLAHILIEQGWHDQAFIQAHTVGFDRFQEVLKDYTPAATSERTGIPEDRIRRLAEQLHGSRPSVVVVDARSLSTSNGLEIARAVLALNAVLGNLERPGGIVARRDLPLADWNALKPDDIAVAGLAKPALDGHGKQRFPFSSSVADALPESVLGETPYPAEALFLYYANPLFSRNNPERFRQAFAKIPFIVSFSPFMDESAYESDLILPDHTYLERWEEALPPPLGFRATIGIRKPVVEPLYGTKHTGDALIGIARNIGGTVADAFPWKDFRSAMEERLAGIARAKRGSIVEDDQADFLKKLAKVGCWNDDPSPAENWKAAFRTASGKFEFYSAAAEAKITGSAAINKLAPADYLKSLGKGALAEACLPHSEPAVFEGAEKEFPMLLFAYKDITYAEGSGENIPLLVELAGLQKGLTGTESWLSWAEINVETAARAGVRQGDVLWVESPLGKIKAYALLREKIAPDVVLMALGRGHTQMGRFAKGRGENPKHIMAAHFDSLSGIVSNRITRVRIAKA